jgi:hypothetical protein
MPRQLLFVISLTIANAIPTGAFANEPLCSYAPSRSIVASRIAGTASGAATGVWAVGNATGITVVMHSSGSAILSGTSGYIAGTLGAAAIAPLIVGTGIFLGTLAAAVEISCLNHNHPNLLR